MKDEALDLALEALEKARSRIVEAGGSGWKLEAQRCVNAITAIKQALALDKMAENARELGLDYEPHKGLSEHLAQATNGRVRIDPVTGNVGIGTAPVAPVQEPVAWMFEFPDKRVKPKFDSAPHGGNWQPLYTNPQPDAYGYAKRLAEAIWKKHYQFTAPQWEPFDHLIGVLTQIDNMASGLITPPNMATPLAAPVQEPVAALIDENQRLRAELKFNTLPAQPAVQEPLTWYEGAPPFPQDQEWFIAETIYGDRVVLRSLDEGKEHKGNYAFKTADQTYMKQEIVKRWMQFPDCAYLPPAQEFVCSTGLCHYKAQPTLKPLTNEQVGKAARDAHIAFCLNKHQTYEHALTRAVEAAHGITGETK